MLRIPCWTCRCSKRSKCCMQRMLLSRDAKAVSDQLDSEKSKSDSLLRELAQSTSQINELKSQINELKSQSALQIKQIKDMESRLSFLSLLMDVDRANSGVWRTDVAVFVQDRLDEPLAAHRFILGNNSPVFRKMFETEMQETETGVIRIDDASFPVMRAVINFCYSAQIDFTYEVTAEDVLPVAHKYGIDLLQKMCEEDLIKTINKVNVPGRLKLAKKFQAEKLESEASEYIRNHYDEVTNVLMDEAYWPCRSSIER